MQLGARTGGGLATLVVLVAVGIAARQTVLFERIGFDPGPCVDRECTIRADIELMVPLRVRYADEGAALRRFARALDDAPEVHVCRSMFPHDRWFADIDILLVPDLETHVMKSELRTFESTEAAFWASWPHAWTPFVDLGMASCVRDVTEAYLARYPIPFLDAEPGGGWEIGHVGGPD